MEAKFAVAKKALDNFYMSMDNAVVSTTLSYMFHLKLSGPKET